jgi:hypothetical protein
VKIIQQARSSSGNGNIVFLFAVNAENLSIEGKGTVDGNGLAFYNGKGDNTGPGKMVLVEILIVPIFLFFTSVTTWLYKTVF